MECLKTNVNSKDMAAPKGNSYAKGCTTSGRPDGYNEAMCIEICERVSLGEHIIKVLESDDRFPTFPTWCRWKREHDELFNAYTRAIQDKSEMVIFEINNTMQQVKDGEMDASSARVIIDTLKWLTSKFYPKMYGDKLDLTSDGDKLNTTPIQITPELIKEIAENL